MTSGFLSSGNLCLIHYLKLFWPHAASPASVRKGNWALGAVEASEVAEAAEVNEAGEVSKAWKITTVDFRVSQVLEFNNFRANIILFLMQPAMNEYKNPRPNPRGPKHHISCRLCYLFILQYSSTSRGVKLPSKPIIANDRIKYKVCYPIR